MINTQLHNELIEKDMQKKLINIDILIQKEKRVLLFEKLKSYLLIIALVFLVLLLLIFLFWIFPNKSFGSNEALPEVIQVECRCNCDKHSKTKEVNPVVKNIEDINATKKKKLKKPKQNLSGDTYKDGNEYVKEGNHIHKRTWEDGDLTEDIILEETIQESRDKHKENIPQISTPEKGEKR